MTSKCQVVFFPILFIPTDRELERLQNIQDAITYSHQNIWHKNKQDKYALASAKFNFYKRVRKNIRVL